MLDIGQKRNDSQTMKKPNLLRAGFFFSLSLFLTVGPSVHAADFLGAAVVLQKLAEKPEGKEKKDVSEAGRLKEAIAAFKAQAATMKPEDAADAWLVLLERSWKVRPSDMTSEMEGMDYESGQKKSVWSALPPPPAWEFLAKKIEARPVGEGKKAARELGLRLLAHVLLGDQAAQKKDLADMEALYQKLDQQDRYSLGTALDQVGEARLQGSDDPDAVMKSVERMLADVGQEESRWGGNLRVPDLVALAGPEKAEAFLRKALVKEKVVVSVEQGEETKKLARRLALELVEQLKSAQWQLAHSLDSLALYEAMEKKFSKPAEEETNNPADPNLGLLKRHRESFSGFNNPQQQAQTYYLLGLISANRSKDAVAVAKKLGKGEYIRLPTDALKAMERGGYTGAIHDFLKELLTQNPELPFWDEYIELAARLGETDKMLDLVRKAAGRTDLSERKRNRIKHELYRALLAAGQVEEGIKELQQALTRKDEPTDESGGGEDMQETDHNDLALQLAKLGQLLGRKELVEQGINAAKAATNQAPNESYNFEYSLDSELVDFLSGMGRGPEAEGILLESLAKASKSKRSQMDYGMGSSLRQSLEGLVRIYYQAGRYGDVVKLLEESPQWGAKDLADIFMANEGFMMGHGRGKRDAPFAIMAATSLAEVGRKEEAKKIVNAFLDKVGGCDSAYQLLIKLGGDNLPGRLDEIFTHDQFEERPLIWKAVLLKEAGKLEEAETMARRAIAIDPSDGEQGPGDRLRAYAVLADVVEARGDKKQADGLREAVNAIRLSEEADRFHEAGLLKQAVKMYEDSLTHFSDAYCIQSRLAIQMAALGMYDAAEEHYRRAYELMPTSFGRVESHCFGCERAFEGEKAQGIAEKVFTELAVKTPDKPQVHYLLGYLRKEQERYKEALEHYREAVRLDPDYLNAWKEIAAVGQSYHLTQADRDNISLQMLRLDPLGRHEGHNFQGVNDLKALWLAVEAAGKLRPVTPKSLLVLTASKAEMEKQESEAKNHQGSFNRSYNYFRENDQPMEAAVIIMQNQMIRPLLYLLGEGNFGMPLD